jgi:hypothetical protein
MPRECIESRGIRAFSRIRCKLDCQSMLKPIYQRAAGCAGTKLQSRRQSIHNGRVASDVESFQHDAGFIMHEVIK